MLKRIIASLLVLVLLFTAVPVTAFAVNEEQTTVDAGDVSIEGTNGFGTLLSQEITQSQLEAADESAAYEAGYTVTDLTIEGTSATVTYDSMEEALLVVALYTEDGVRMVTSATATVTAEETEAVVEFTGEMPEYFLASAYLMDTYDLSPLCAAYDTPMYTREMQELLASTVEDYDADRVLNLDDDNTTNFAVYAETTKVIEAVEGVNTVASIDDENATYVIQNADEQITSLVVGDIFVYPFTDEDLLIVKVAELTIDGTSVTIIGDELTMEEVFSHVKIDGELGTDGVDVDESTAGEGITYNGKSDADNTLFHGDIETSIMGVDGEISRETAANFDYQFVEKGVFSLKGKLSIQTKVSFEYYITWSYQRVEFKVDFGGKIGVEAEISGSTKGIDVPIGTLRFPVLPGITIAFTPKFIVKASVTVSGSLEFTSTLGFGFEHSDRGTKFLNLCATPKATLDFEIEGKIFIGFKLTPAVKVLEGALADAEVSGELGFEIKGSIVDVSTGDSPDTKHECIGCLDGNVAFQLKVTPELTFLKSKKLKFSTELVNAAWDLFDFYLCAHHLEAGLGHCPRIVHKLTVEVKDSEGNAVSDAVVTVRNTSGQTNQNGIAEMWLSAAYYTVNVTDSSGDRTGSTGIYVDSPSKAKILLSDKQNNDLGILGTIASEIITDTVTVAETTYNGHTYKLIDSHMTWSEAQAYCESVGGYLVTVTSAAENTVIVNLLSKSATKNCYWIGLFRESVTAPWQWVTGENFSFQNWADYEPNNNDGEGEMTVHLFGKKYTGGRGTKHVGTWNDASNDGAGYANTFYDLNNFGLICEFDSTDISDAPENVNGAIKAPGSSGEVNAVYPGDYGTDVTDAYVLKTASFTDLVPNEQYVLLAMKSIEVENPLVSDNLLFIDQAVALEDGTLSFRYVQRETADISYVVACGASNKNLKDAEITFPEMTADGELQVVDPTVVYNGVTLTEGRDYVIVGTVDFTKGGTYTCYVRGIHNYTGLVECSYTVSTLAEEVANGWSGYTTWVLTDDGKLTFSGEGAMKNYDYDGGQPWLKYTDQITSVVIEEGVTSVGSGAFRNLTTLKSVTFPATTLTKMGEAAFYGTGLTAVEIPASLWTIQPYTFKNCTALTEVKFNEGNLMKISDGAFYGTGLTTVELPDCLDILDVYAFKNCAALENITLGSGMTELREAVFYGTAISTIEVPEGITKIGPYAFKNCVNLETIDLPTTLKSVGEASFYACTGLKTVKLPDAVTSIGNYAFRKCAAIETLTFGTELTTIGECSFYGCTGLTEIVIPDKVTTIKPYAFKTCTGLTSVTLGSSVKTIGEGAFNTCTGLKTIVFPASLTTIGNYCFSGSENLWKLTFQGDAPAIGTGAFKGMDAYAYYPGGNTTWTADTMQNYGGKITWKAQ